MIGYNLNFYMDNYAAYIIACSYLYIVSYAYYDIFLFTPCMVGYAAYSVILLFNYAIFGYAAYIIIPFCLSSIWTTLPLVLKIVVLK